MLIAECVLVEADSRGSTSLWLHLTPRALTAYCRGQCFYRPVPGTNEQALHNDLILVALVMQMNFFPDQLGSSENTGRGEN